LLKLQPLRGNGGGGGGGGGGKALTFARNYISRNLDLFFFFSLFSSFPRCPVDAPNVSILNYF